MNKPLSLIPLLALAMTFVACETNPATDRRDTVFHSAEDSPRSGSTGSNRYGLNGTHSPQERKKITSRKKNTRPKKTETRKKKARSNSDPNGIVKPRDLDPKPERSEEVEIVSSDPPLKKKETKPAPSPAPTGDAPYAEAVPGKTGLVYSPFVANKKDALVNVTDENNVPLPPGTEVVDPLTGKTFRVP